MASPARTARLAAEASGFTQVYQRGRGNLVMRKPGTDQYCVDSGIGDIGWHYGASHDQEVDTAWTADTGAWQWKMNTNDFQTHARSVFNVGDLFEFRKGNQWVIFDPQSINWINQDNSRQQIAIKQAITGQVNDDILSFPNGYGAGRHFQYRNDTSRLQKLITIDASTDLPDPTVTGTIWFEAEFSLATSTDLDIYLDGVLWTKPNGVRVRTANRIEFKDSTTGEVRWWLGFPRAFDSALRQEEHQRSVIGEMEVRRQGGPSSLFITVRIPKTWIDQAVFPIYIDPTVDVDVAADNEDGGSEDLHTWIDSTGGPYGLSYMGNQSNSLWDGGWIFRSTGVTQGADITAATITLTDGEDRNLPLGGAWWGFDVDSPTDFSETFGEQRISDWHTRTTATVTDNVNTAGNHTSPSLVTIIQEIVDRVGYAGDIGLTWRDTKATGTYYYKWVDYGDSAANAATLHIEYTTGAAGRTTKNTDPRPLGIFAGISRKVNTA